MFICIRGFSSWPKFVAVVVGWTAVCLSHGSIQKAKAELWKMEQGKSGLKGNRGRDSIRQKTGPWEMSAHSVTLYASETPAELPPR